MASIELFLKAKFNYFCAMQIGNIDFGNLPLFLAPMEDVTYKSFRYMCKKYGADAMYTEFVSSEALIRDVKKTKQKMTLFDFDRPVAIQIFGHNIDSMVAAAKVAEGWDEGNKIIVDVAERMQDTGIKALAIHGRTRKQLYTGEADWTLIGEVKNNPRMHIPIIGNGDINGPEKAKQFYDQTGVDALMIGRGAIGRPWIFKEVKHYFATGEILPPPTVQEVIQNVKDSSLTQFQRIKNCTFALG
jgi:tRNA-dihydrouridine synthase B